MRGSNSSGGLPLSITGDRTFTGITTLNKRLIVFGESGSSAATLQLRPASGQTGPLLEIYNLSGTRVAYFDSSGNFTSTGAQSYQSTQVVQGATGVGFSVKRDINNASSIQEWQDESGTPLLWINHSGLIQGNGGFILNGSTTITLSGSQSLAINTPYSSVGLSAADSSGLVIVSNNSTYTLSLSDQGNAGSGPHIRLQNSTGYRYLRYIGDQLQQLDNSYTTVLWSVADNGFGFVSGNYQVNKRLFVDTANLNTGSGIGGIDVAFGSLTSTEGIGSKRSATGNQFGLDFYTNSTARVQITNNGNVSFGTNLQINNANSSTDPGIPFIRSDGTNLIINPTHIVNTSNPGTIFLCWDVLGTVSTGGPLTTVGIITSGAGVLVTSGDIVVSSTTNTNPHFVLKHGNQNKYIRLDTDSTLRIMNSAYSATLLSLDDTGTLSLPGVFSGSSASLTAANSALNLQLIGDNTTNPTLVFRNVGPNNSGTQSKYMRLSNTGYLEIVNSAYNSVLLNLSNTGALSVLGRIYHTALSFPVPIVDGGVSNLAAADSQVYTINVTSAYTGWTAVPSITVGWEFINGFYGVLGNTASPFPTPPPYSTVTVVSGVDSVSLNSGTLSFRIVFSFRNFVNWGNFRISWKAVQ